jgi:hypothetical protein
LDARVRTAYLDGLVVVEQREGLWHEDGPQLPADDAQEAAPLRHVEALHIPGIVNVIVILFERVSY